jgi:hypothetical protein
LILLLLVFICSGLLLDALGLLIHKPAQISFVLVWMFAILSFALWKAKVACPQCGWNIYLKKTDVMPFMTYVPSSCPKCGLDLERRVYG